MENKRLFGKLSYLHRQMCRENNVLFSEYGITPVQMHAMVHVNRKMKGKEKVCQKDIEKFINLRASSVSTLLSNLEKRGFITRTVSEGDARTKYIELTEKGEDVCVKNKLLMDKCDAAIELVLSEEEKQLFDNLLTKIIESISN